MRIVFMGTPDFAVASLAALVAAGKNVVAVVTAPDKPSGRGLQLSESAVKKYALAQGLPLMQPANLKAEAFLAELRSYQADLQVVVAFRMLPEVVWAMPLLGTFNLHASLLPQYRGAAPINWAIINGETETGVTTFFLQHEIDTGSVIFQEKVAIAPNDTLGELYPTLMDLGAKLVLKTCNAIEAGNYTQTPQLQGVELKHAPKIHKETCQINWQMPASQIRNLIRGLSPYPAAFCFLQNKICKIYEAELAPQPSATLPNVGDFCVENKQLLFRCGTGYLSVKNLQLEGKKRLPIADFLLGFRA
jgi:methionyl-tRNA formyltransferase